MLHQALGGLSIWMLALVTVVGAQKTLKVPESYKTIQAAIDAASTSDTVLVAPGVYRERISFKGKAIHVLGRDGAAATTLDGEQKGSVVIFSGGEGRTSVLEGFTITNGLGDSSSPSFTGAGATCSPGTSPTIIRNRFVANTAGWGMAVFCWKSGSPLIEDNHFARNSGTSTGAIMARECAAEIRGNRFERNVGTMGAGAVEISSNSAVVQGNVFLYNRTRFDGGAIEINFGSALVSDNTFVGNRASNGGAINVGSRCGAQIVNNRFLANYAETDGGACFNAGDTIFTNNTVVANEAWGSGGGVYSRVGKLTVTNSILWNNWSLGIPEADGADVVEYSDIQGGHIGTGNLDVDPGFVDAEGGDLHLRHDSPVKNKGSNSAPHLAAQDCDGNGRVGDGTVDIGADEFAPHAWTAGRATAGGELFVRVVGAPSTSAYVAFGLFPQPLVPPHLIPGVGAFHIRGSFVLLDLGLIPAAGVTEMMLTLPEDFPARRFPMQGLINGKLSPLHVVETVGRIRAVPEHYASVQAGIDAAEDGDTVLVSAGRYVENLDFKGKSIWVISRAGREWTTLDGGQNGTGAQFISREDRGARLAGFTVCNANGCGIVISYESHPTICDNLITGNTGPEGAGVNVGNGSPMIRGNEIVGNRTIKPYLAEGGGVYLGNRNVPHVIGNLIARNLAQSNGGGIAIGMHVKAVICGNRVVDNKAATDGGGIALRSGGFMVCEQNEIVANRCTAGFGGGLVISNPGTNLGGCTICANEAYQGGGGIYFGAANGQLANCVVRDNQSAKGSDEIDYTTGSAPTSIIHCNVEGGPTNSGNIDLDPRFVDPPQHDFHLGFDSPCRDAGTILPRMAARDVDGDLRIVAGKVDIGADEFSPRAYHTGAAQPGQTIQVNVLGRPGDTVYWALSLTPTLRNPPLVIPGFGSFGLQGDVHVLPLGKVPATGVIHHPIALPHALPVPLPIPHQALIGSSLTGVEWVRIR